jgi:plasmid stabilization system protein ParE
MSYSIKYLDEAKIDLKDIVIYISDYNNSVAKKFIKFLTDKIERELSITPHMYREYSP